MDEGKALRAQHAAPASAYETALVECAAGHQAALAQIYVVEKRRLREAARRIVRDGDRADDIVHDAFVQILRDAASFDPARGSARAWIYTIVRNTALKSRRNADREVAVEDEKLVAVRNREQTRAPPSRGMDYPALRTHLEALEPRKRASLILAFIDGRTHAEIAALMGVPLGTVKSWIRRELRALRAQFK